MRLKDQGKKVNITNSTNNKEQVTDLFIGFLVKLLSSA